MVEHKCDRCGFRIWYEDNPKSILGRIWNWHATWCPGWKSYITSLPEGDRINLAQKYDLKKYQE